MDERLAKALEFTNFRKSMQAQKDQLKLKAQGQLIISQNGGIFGIDRELIAFTKALLDQGYDSAVLLDNNENPIKIDNLKKFADDCIIIYFKTTTQYYENWEKLRKQRTTQGVIEW